uniref:Uncharacterized protein n=2 Tax=Cyprinus carpio TaxID=7962 RepID=A0A8C1GA34_CYPCA
YVHYTFDSATSAFSSASSSSCYILRNLPRLQFLDLFLSSFHSNLFCFIQAVLQVFNGLLHVLLHTLQGEQLCPAPSSTPQPSCFIPATCFRLQSTLQGVYGPLQLALSVCL